MIKRTIETEIVKHLTHKEITIIVGTRQVGKTTLLKKIFNSLKKSKETVLFFNLDIESDSIYFESQEKLLQKIKLETKNKKAYIFIDEIQRKENAGLFLKGLYDMGLPYKFIVTGSGSLELKEKIHESLAGRKRMFEMNTVSFEEFVNYKTNYKYEKSLQDFFTIESNKTMLFFSEYINYGGYPRIIVENNLAEKKLIINEIFSSYIEKDISYFLHVNRTEAFKQMIRLLANQSGQIINYSALAQNTNVSIPTLMNYLWFAEKTFIIKKLTPYARNFVKEITKSPIIYFTDIGFRNFAVNAFGLIDEFNKGFVFQNMIFNILSEKSAQNNWDLHFWRTKDKAEVDFVIDTKQNLIAVEVKCSNYDKPILQRSMHSFIGKYNPSEVWIINLSYQNTILKGDTTIKYIPFYRLFD